MPTVDVAFRAEEGPLLREMALNFEGPLGMAAEHLGSGNPDLREIRAERPSGKIVAAVGRDNQRQDCNRLENEEERGIGAQALGREPQTAFQTGPHRFAALREGRHSRREALKVR